MEISGGFGVTATIRNFGNVTVTNAVWNITFKGGFVIPAQKTGTIPTISISGQSKIKMVAFGFGKKTITVTVMADDGIAAEQTASGFLFLFFVLGVK